MTETRMQKNTYFMYYVRAMIIRYDICMWLATRCTYTRMYIYM